MGRNNGFGDSNILFLYHRQATSGYFQSSTSMQMWILDCCNRQDSCPTSHRKDYIAPQNSHDEKLDVARKVAKGPRPGSF